MRPSPLAALGPTAKRGLSRAEKAQRIAAGSKPWLIWMLHLLDSVSVGQRRPACGFQSRQSGHSPIGSGPHISTCHFAPSFERAAFLSFSRSFCGKLSPAGRRSPLRNTVRRRARAPLAGGRHHETTRWRSWQFSLRAIIRRPYSHHGCLLSISTACSNITNCVRAEASLCQT